MLGMKLIAFYSLAGWHLTPEDTVSTTTRPLQGPPVAIEDAWRNEPIFNGGDAWASLHKTVRYLDENKVKDCKEDVDTLLVFAGLYSAVLTAFLIESYQMLQEDPQQTVIQLLRQISQQTAGSSGAVSSLNATLPSASSFHPSTSNICSNVCWFASLILSLSAASYSILVKQWLREYLSIDSTVPQECIRIRHFRYHGLEKWRLFEIAAMLPLILQLSLALFFVGLCFFTAGVHPSIGGTSVGMVSAWALFFIFAVLAPLLSARCPYKTTFLKSTFRFLRPLVQQSLYYSSSCIATAIYHITIKRDITGQQDPERAESHTELHEMDTTPVQQDTIFLDRDAIVLFHLLEYPPEEASVDTEEDDIRRSGEKDLVIFNNIDTLLLDDSVLELMRAVLRTRPPLDEKVLGFVVAVIRCRVCTTSGITTGADARTGHMHILSYGIQVDALLPTKRMCLVNILSDVLDRALIKTTVDRWYLDPDEQGLDWMDDALALLIALIPPLHATPDSVACLLRKLLAPSPDGPYNGCGLLANHIITTVAEDPTTAAWQCHVFSVAAGALAAVEPEVFKIVVHWSYVSPEDVIDASSNSFARILAQIKLAQESGEASDCTISLDTLVALVEVAGLILYTAAKNYDATHGKSVEHVYPGLNELLEFVAAAVPIIDELCPDIDLTCPRISEGVGLDIVFMTLFSVPTLVYSLLEVFTKQPDLLSTDAASRLLFDPLLHIEKQFPLAGKVSADARIFALAQYFDAQYQAEAAPDLLFLLHVSLMLAFLPSDSNEASRIILDKAFACIDRAYNAARASGSLASAAKCDKIGQVAHRIIHVMDSYADGTVRFRTGRRGACLTDRDRIEEDNRYKRWAEWFDITQTRFSDELVDMLRNLSSSTEDEFGRTFWRIRRLESLPNGKGLREDSGTSR
ncbi:hypothetical protein NM688_g7377 [Phlebia brevispora]|uniref:Uncharacterized protein n=1 Tax=Phlebia brevispora TaxID=194682 RepID=A0ACC1S6G0_9APHY|nr:hypothetical protein NM688_g7377 [Phlebia brevispora]